MSEQEKKDKKFSMILTGLIHGLVALLLIFLVAWREPDPPIPEYGIELNFGFEEEGGGDIERDTPAQVEETEEDTPPDAEVETEEVETEEIQETETEQVQEEEVPPTETTTEEVAEEPPAEETVVDPITTETESEVKAEEKKEEVVEEKKEETTPPKKEVVEEKPPVEEKKEVVKPKPKPKPTLDSRALMGGKKTDSKSKETASNNQGDDRSKMGNQGNPKGDKNTSGENPGGAELGYSLSLDGWRWESPPADKDDSQIDGVIKFAIDVDDRGKVLKASIIPGTTISDNTIVEFYRKQVMRLSFIQIDASKAPAPISKGEVTFVIKTN